MNEPLIGILPLMDKDRNSIWMFPPYLDAVRAAGGVPVVLTPTDRPAEAERMVSACDGLLFTGGHDVNPVIYGEEPLPGTEISRERDTLESLVLPMALERDLAILGICRGMQFISAYLGGKLYQDLPTQCPSEVSHQMLGPFDRMAHTVTVVPGTPLQDLLGCEEMGVNSLHHQAVRTPAPDMRVMATSPDGVVEAVYHPEKKFVWGVQWHPEFLYPMDENSRKMFAAFLEAASRH